MTIEKMKIEDYDEIYGLWAKCDGITLRVIDDSKDGILMFLKRNPNTNFVCRINGSIIGCILCGHDGRKGFIYHTVVKEDYRGKGIGTKLVGCAIDSLKKENITKIGVFVNSDNLRGNNFWDLHGFKQQENLIYRILPLNNSNF